MNNKKLVILLVLIVSIVAIIVYSTKETTVFDTDANITTSEHEDINDCNKNTLEVDSNHNPDYYKTSSYGYDVLQQVCGYYNELDINQFYYLCDSKIDRTDSICDVWENSNYAEDEWHDTTVHIVIERNSPNKVYFYKPSEGLYNLIWMNGKPANYMEDFVGYWSNGRNKYVHIKEMDADGNYSFDYYFEYGTKNVVVQNIKGKLREVSEDESTTAAIMAISLIDAYTHFKIDGIEAFGIFGINPYEFTVSFSDGINSLYSEVLESKYTKIFDSSFINTNRIGINALGNYTPEKSETDNSYDKYGYYNTDYERDSEGNIVARVDTITKFDGTVVGTVTIDTKGNKTVRNFSGRILGTYDIDSNVTRDFSGTIISRGDTSSSLFELDK